MTCVCGQPMHQPIQDCDDPACAHAQTSHLNMTGKCLRVGCPCQAYRKGATK